MKDEALRLALEALETLHDENMDYLTRNKLGGENNQCMVFAREAITAIKAALEAKDEPVAYGMRDTMIGKGNRMMYVRLGKGQDGCTVPLYTTPPQRTWVGLTDEEIEVIEVLRAPPVHPDFVDCDDWVEFARAIEAKLKERNI